MADTDMFEIDNDLLIHLVEQRPVIWNKTLDDFKDRNATRQAWNEVCIHMRNDFDELEDSRKNEFCKEITKRWKNLRDAFIKCIKKEEEFKSSGPQTRKKRKYIFNDELQFLRKIYGEKNTEESYSHVDEDNGTDEEIVLHEPLEVMIVAENTKLDKKVISKNKSTTTKHKYINERDLNIVQALDKKEPEQKNSKLLFLESLLPHVEKFNDDQWLECQLEFLQVITKIKNKHHSST